MSRFSISVLEGMERELRELCQERDIAWPQAAGYHPATNYAQAAELAALLGFTVELSWQNRTGILDVSDGQDSDAAALTKKFEVFSGDSAACLCDAVLKLANRRRS